MTEPGERPRWSFTWLLRVQRVGRNRPERAADGEAASRGRLWRVVLVVVLAGVIIVEVWLGILLGILPR